MKDFGRWLREVRPPMKAPEEVDGRAWMKCRSCGKDEFVDLKSYMNGDTGWYIETDVEPDETYEGVCGGSQFCLP